MILITYCQFGNFPIDDHLDPKWWQRLFHSKDQNHFLLWRKILHHFDGGGGGQNGILWDEAMATAAFRWTKDNPGGLLVGLVGCDHVKFRNGIPARYSRMVGDTADCITVMLNPTPVDTRSSRSMVRDLESISSVNPDLLTLQLRYLKDGVDPDSDDRALASSTGGVLPLADYLVMG